MDHETIERPPLGLRPSKFFDEELCLTLLKRVIEITQAMDRYIEAKATIPDEWFGELNRRVESLNQFRQMGYYAQDSE